MSHLLIDFPVFQLRVVFDACDSEGEGRISLSQLANLSRSHCAGHLELLEIFQVGEDTEDSVDFQQFCQQMINFMGTSREEGEVEREVEREVEMEVEREVEKDEFADSYSEVNVKTINKRNNSSHNSPKIFSPHLSDQGAFNENLKRSFEKTRSGAVMTSSPHRGRMKKKVSQARLAGNIPLVNTSSEDEAEDSFDRQIANSLSVAR